MSKTLNLDQRNRIAEKIIELGNLAFIGLVISQIVSTDKTNFVAILGGIIIIILAYWYAVKFMQRR